MKINAEKTEQSPAQAPTGLPVSFLTLTWLILRAILHVLLPRPCIQASKILLIFFITHSLHMGCPCDYQHRDFFFPIMYDLEFHLNSNGGILTFERLQHLIQVWTCSCFHQVLLNSSGLSTTRLEIERVLV